MLGHKKAHFDGLHYKGDDIQIRIIDRYTLNLDIVGII